MPDKSNRRASARQPASYPPISPQALSRGAWAKAYQDACSELASELRARVPKLSEAELAALGESLGLEELIASLERGGGEPSEDWIAACARYAELGPLRERAAEIERASQFAASIDRKGALYRLCGVAIEGRACKVCATIRPNSAQLVPVPGARWCNARVCETCGKYSSIERANKIETILQQIDLIESHSLFHITFTIKQSEKAQDFAAMEARVRGVLAALRGGWNPKRVYGLRKSRAGLRKVRDKQVTSGLYAKIEISDSATIHAHGLYYGPFVVKEELEKLLARGYSECGFIKIRRVATNEQLKLWRKLLIESNSRKLERWEEIVIAKIGASVREIAKYITKAPGPASEAYQRGARRDRLDPRLAAHWEAALYRVRAAASYGCFRGLDPLRNASPEEIALAAEIAREAGYQTARERHQADADAACPCCGVVGEYDWASASRGAYLHQCAKLGIAAYPPRESRALAPPALASPQALAP